MGGTRMGEADRRPRIIAPLIDKRRRWTGLQHGRPGVQAVLRLPVVTLAGMIFRRDNGFPA